ncbi:MAG: 8-hydroxy-5-deazaflavin:NADPH oxidoreductase [Actinomycetota bacterium]|jgi:predicted dinucleotide-binding enzyme|nr:8-hydroxy-5-deazaflavin:NADPH oxidoreductase [Actinomycetota bacterium]
MKIGIIGAGQIGHTLTGLLVQAGHDVWVANKRGPQSLTGVLAPLGEHAHAATVADAARTGELVVVSVPVRAYRDLPASLLAGKVVIDTGNYDPGRDGPIPELDGGRTTGTELLAALLPDSRVVKMFNTIFYEHLRVHRQPAGSPGRRALPMTGDDTEAKATVAAVVDQIGFDTVDAGPLEASHGIGRGTPVFDIRLDAEQLRAALDL